MSIRFPSRLGCKQDQNSYRRRWKRGVSRLGASWISSLRLLDKWVVSESRLFWTWDFKIQARCYWLPSLGNCDGKPVNTGSVSLFLDRCVSGYHVSWLLACRLTHGQWVCVTSQSIDRSMTIHCNRCFGVQIKTIVLARSPVPLPYLFLSCADFCWWLLFLP